MPASSADHFIEQAIGCIGGRWRAILICRLANGPKRFSDLLKEIPGLSQRMLSLDLHKLEEAGIVTRTAIAEVPVKVEYRLTPEGVELLDVIDGLARWAEMLAARRYRNGYKGTSQLQMPTPNAPPA